LLACEHDPTSAPPHAGPPCLADAVPPLVLGWQQRAECTAENLACRSSCAAGDANACFSRALSLERTPATEPEAHDLFRRACQLGLATGCTNWAAGEWYRDDTGPHVCAYRMFEKTCAADDPFGCGMAGRILVNDALGLASLARGRLELELTCARLGGFPCRILASFIERGTFAADESPRIPELLKRACSGGDDDACGDHATVEETFHSE
jgi:hypothetical protein